MHARGPALLHVECLRVAAGDAFDCDQYRVDPWSVLAAWLDTWPD